MALCMSSFSCYFLSRTRESFVSNRNGAFGLQRNRSVSYAVAASSSPKAAEAPLASNVHVMVNDCTGRMGRAVAEAAIEIGLQLVPVCLTGPGKGGDQVVIEDIEVKVYDSEKDAILEHVLSKYPNVIIADFTLPAAVNENAELYCRKQIPFVMGTTGGDREKLLEIVRSTGSYAVIAPQMGKQVVAFQAAFEIMAEEFPDAFSGYKLKVIESHQSSKVDTSGTAKAVVSCFRKLGISFSDEEIEMIRNSEEQIQRMGVPGEYLNGHAFHSYYLTSPDGSVTFQFQHNVCGRSIYAHGTVDAVLFLARKVHEKAEKKVYNMIDVLRAGSMR